MIKEEAIKEIKEMSDYWEEEYPEAVSEIEALKMAIKALEGQTPESIQKMQELEQAEIEKAYELGKAEKQQWIPVSERLPEDNTKVLVTIDADYREKVLIT